MTAKKTSKNPTPKPKDAPARDAPATTKEAAPVAATTAATLSQQIDALKTLDLDGLRKQYLATFGHPTAAKDKDALVTRISERLALAGKGAPAPKKAPRAATPAPGSKPTEKKPKAEGSPFTADPRLPAPGSTISVTHKGVTHDAKFLGADGFEYEKERFRSLSAIARRILGGAQVNGFLYFGLTKPKAAKPEGEKQPATAKRASKAAKKPAAKKAKR